MYLTFPIFTGLVGSSTKEKNIGLDLLNFIIPVALTTKRGRIWARPYGNIYFTTRAY